MEGGLFDLQRFSLEESATDQLWIRRSCRVGRKGKKPPASRSRAPPGDFSSLLFGSGVRPAASRIRLSPSARSAREGQSREESRSGGQEDRLRRAHPIASEEEP